MAKKFFTLDEANALLPILRTELEQLQNIKRQFEEKYYELLEMKEQRRTGADESADPDPFFAQECELEFLQIEAKGIIRSIHGKGAELKDIEEGLIDFPAIIDGKEVLLCWKKGEEKISHYHGIWDGFAGRRPIGE